MTIAANNALIAIQNDTVGTMVENGITTSIATPAVMKTGPAKRCVRRQVASLASVQGVWTPNI